MSNAADLTGNQRNAYTLLKNLLKQYGLESLSDRVLGFVKAGYDGPTVGVLIQDTPEYKQRFKANAVRVKNGYAPLSPAEYMSTESAYDQAARAHGLPKSFMDTDALLGMDVSPTEMNERATMAGRFVDGMDPAYKRAFASMFGTGGRGNAIAAMLDPNKALQVLQSQMSQAELGVAASKAGRSIGAGTAQDLVGRGKTAGELLADYAEADDIAQPTSHLASIHGQQYGMRDAEAETVYGSAAAKRKREKIQGLEKAEFSGGGNAAGAFKSAGNNF